MKLHFAIAPLVCTLCIFILVRSPASSAENSDPEAQFAHLICDNSIGVSDPAWDANPITAYVSVEDKAICQFTNNGGVPGDQQFVWNKSKTYSANIDECEGATDAEGWEFAAIDEPALTLCRFAQNPSDGSPPGYFFRSMGPLADTSSAIQGFCRPIGNSIVLPKCQHAFEEHLSLDYSQETLPPLP